jgi:hypothetical protein
MKLSEMKDLMRRREREWQELNNWSTLKQRIETALAMVVDRDFELLEDGPSERSVAHRLAVYLEHEFPGWHVDCEFNRQGEEGKRGTKRVSASPLLPESWKGTGKADVSPDIVVHRRRRQQNLLAMEVKSVTSDGLDRDREKLRKYLTDPHLKYAFAVLVTFRNGVAAFEPIERIESR